MTTLVWHRICFQEGCAGSFRPGIDKSAGHGHAGAEGRGRAHAWRRKVESPPGSPYIPIDDILPPDTAPPDPALDPIIISDSDSDSDNETDSIDKIPPSRLDPPGVLGLFHDS